MAGNGSLAAGTLAAALMLGTVGPALATEPPAAPPAAIPATPPAEPDPLSTWERAAYKTLTFQTAANLADVALFGAIFEAGAGTSAIFLVANTATAAMLYYPYELAWDRFGPPPSETTADTLATKAVGYQVLTGARNLALSYVFTGSLLPSAGFAAAAFAIDTAIYATNDVAWDYFRPRAER